MTFRILRRLLASTFAALALAPAHADNPVTGASLYASHCASCHGNAPLTSNGSKIYFGRNARAVIETAIATNNSGMGSLRGAFPTNGSQIADVAAYLGNSPSTLTFPSTNVGSTSASTQTVTVTASLKGAAYAISGLSVAATGDYARAGGTCGTAVAAGTSCTVIVSFTPTAAGTRSGAVTISHNNTLTPVSIALSGTGASAAPAAPTATISPTTVTLADTAIGATSAAQNVTVGNTGTAALALSAITLSNSADFAIAGGTCAAGGSVAPGASCTVSLSFHPAAGATGARSGSLSIAHNAAGSPGTVALGGNATAAAAPVAALTSSLNFGSVNVGSTSAAQTATLSNTGSAPLTIGTIATGSGEFPLGAGSCSGGGSVAAGASCSVNLAFAPAAAGARSGTLAITHNAAGGSSGSSLSGTGVALTPAIGLSPSALGFTQTVGTTSAAQTVTLSNPGTAPLALGTITLAGAQAAEFQIAGGSTCVAGGSVGAGASCVLNITFAPAATGARSASVSITHNAAGSPSGITLNGSATATPQPAISLNAATLTFAAQTVATTSATQVVVISNSGAAPLTLSAFGLTGTAASDFARSGTCSTGSAMAAGATCTVIVSFTPAAVGARSATLSIASNASNGSAALSLAGTGAAVATPTVSLSTGTLAFGNQTVSTASAARSVTLTNTGSGALSLASVTATAGFGVSHGCGTSVAAGASCSLAVTFAPSAIGAASGSVAIGSNAVGSPHAIALSGAGVAASPVLAWTPATTSLVFGDVPVGAAPRAQTLSLTNQGPGTTTLQAITLAGAQATDFSIAGTGTCTANLTLAANAGCSVTVAFQPGAVGARGATLLVTSSGTNPPDLALSGNGSALAGASIGVVPGALSFTPAPGASTASPQALTLQNTGNAVLRVTAVRIASGSFTLGTPTSGACAATPFDLMPGQTCALSVGWSGPSAAAETGALEIDSSAAATPQQVPLQATPTAVAAPPAATAPTLSNAGGGGCSLSNGHSLADPTLWLLTLAAMGVLMRRRARRH